MKQLPQLDLDRLRTRFDHALAFAQKQVRGLIERDPYYYPMYTVDGKWRHEGELWTKWCDGFLPGMMWIFYARGGDDDWREQAKAYTLPLEERKFDRDVHDLNFVLGSSYGRWYDLTGEQELLEVVIQAGRTMALRFQEKGQYLRSFVAPESLFIDIMMNIPIVFRAANETGDKRLREVADAHCHTTIKTIVRDDGSTAHEGIFDTETGEFIEQTTHQGYNGESCWVRGLAWSLYGFGSCHLLTEDPVYLETAERNADYFCDHLPDSGITPYDFDAPADENRTDTSGSAIAASGLLQLARLTRSPEKAKRYAVTAFHMLDALCGPDYLADETPGWEGILKEQIYHIHKDLGVGESCMFGEYFFVEALHRALNGIVGEGEGAGLPNV